MAGVAGGGTDSYGQARTAIRREEARGEELCICSRTVSHHTHSTLVWRQEVEPEEELQRAITFVTAHSNKMPPCKDLASERAQTLRKLSSPLSADDLQNAEGVMIDRTLGLSSRAKERSPLTNEELDDIVNSLHNITPHDAAIDWIAVRSLLAEVAHLSHKDWSVTGRNSDRLSSIILGSNADEGREGRRSSECGRLTAGSHQAQMFERILHEGNWGGAANHAQRARGSNPWAVLVTGVNGSKCHIRRVALTR